MAAAQLSPAAGVSPPRVERAELRIPTATEMRALVDAAAATPYGIPVLLAATTGMRRGEVLELHGSDVDLDACTISIRRGKTGTARRRIHLPASTVAALRAHRKEQAERRLLCGPAWQDMDLVCDRGDGGRSTRIRSPTRSPRSRTAPTWETSGSMTCDTGSRRHCCGPV